jgi:hypothetical protein
MSSNTCEVNVGRLMEIRVGAGYQSVRDVDRMIAMMQHHMSQLAPGQKFVVAADWRKVTMMSPETAARAREMLTRSNPRVIRSTILTLPDRSAANLQVVRLVREAESENRRHFTSAHEQYRWLCEVLREPEQIRLYDFLGLDAERRGGFQPGERLAPMSLRSPAAQGSPSSRGPSSRVPSSREPSSRDPLSREPVSRDPASRAPSTDAPLSLRASQRNVPR